MSGWLTNGVPNISLFTGNEQAPFDTESSNGVSPQSASATLMQLATWIKYLNTHHSTAGVAGTRFYVGINLGNPALLTGVEVLVGATGGTDLWLAELHDSTGALVATSATAGATAGTALQFQRLAFTSTYQAAAGTYYIAIQSNGTTASIATYDSPGLPLVTGSATGVFGTGAAITPPTTYTVDLGPVSWVY